MDPINNTIQYTIVALRRYATFGNEAQTSVSTIIMIRCFKYINHKALEYVEQEMKDMGLVQSKET